MVRRAAFISQCVLVLLLALGVPAAHAAGQACYPPPCGDPAPPTLSVTAGAPVVSADAAGPRSPAPVVAVGLLMLMSTLSTLCLRRRMAIVGPSPGGRPVPTSARADAPASRRPQRSAV